MSDKLVGASTGVAGKLVVSGDIPDVDFGVTNYSFFSIGGYSDVSMDFITGDIHIISGTSMTGGVGAPVENSVISVVLEAGATLYYVVTGKVLT